MNWARLALAAALLGGAAPLWATAAEKRVALDSTRSNAGFSVLVMWMWPVRGQFTDFLGAVTLDAATGLARVEARIGAASVAMRNPGHADWAKSDEFFAAASHPQIHFLSDPFAPKLLASGGDLPGTLELRGIRKPAIFEVRASGCDAWSDAKCAVEVRGQVRRSDYGMASRRATLSDRVWLRFTLYLADS